MGDSIVKFLFSQFLKTAHCSLICLILLQYFFGTILYAQDIGHDAIICSLPIESNHKSSERISSNSNELLTEPPEFNEVFLFAKGRWENILNSPIPINIKVNWAPIDGFSLAVMTVGGFYKGLQNSQHADIWYPVTLAEKLETKELNSDKPDIFIYVNSKIDWYFGLDGLTPIDKYDLATVLIHEIAHGLGFISSATFVNGQGHIGIDDKLLVFDLLIENSKGLKISSVDNHSHELGENFVNGELYLNVGKQSPVKLYAPPFFEPQTSISHFDPEFIVTNDMSSIMLPVIYRGTSFHQIEDDHALINALETMGWFENSNIRLTVYPNPSEGEINFESHGLEVEIISVFDMFGKLAHWESIESNHSIRIFDSGCFVIVFDVGNRRIYKKIVIY